MADRIHQTPSQTVGPPLRSTSPKDSIKCSGQARPDVGKYHDQGSRASTISSSSDTLPAEQNNVPRSLTPICEPDAPESWHRHAIRFSITLLKVCTALAGIAVAVYFGWRTLQYARWEAGHDFREGCRSDVQENRTVTPACVAALDAPVSPPPPRLRPREPNEGASYHYEFENGWLNEDGSPEHYSISPEWRAIREPIVSTQSAQPKWSSSKQGDLGLYAFQAGWHKTVFSTEALRTTTLIVITFASGIFMAIFFRSRKELFKPSISPAKMDLDDDAVEDAPEEESQVCKQCKRVLADDMDYNEKDFVVKAVKAHFDAVDHERMSSLIQKLFVTRLHLAAAESFTQKNRATNEALDMQHSAERSYEWKRFVEAYEKDLVAEIDMDSKHLSILEAALDTIEAVGYSNQAIFDASRFLLGSERSFLRPNRLRDLDIRLKIAPHQELADLRLREKAWSLDVGEAIAHRAKQAEEKLLPSPKRPPPELPDLKAYNRLRQVPEASKIPCNRS